MADLEVIQSILGACNQIALDHDVCQVDHSVNSRSGNVVLLAQLLNQEASYRDILCDVAVLKIEGAIAVDVLILLFEGNCEIRAHILFAVHCGSGEEVLIVNGAQADIHSLCESLLLLPEDCLNLCDCGAECEAIQGVVFLILAENGVKVLHDSSAEDCSGNVDNRVDVGKVDVNDSVALYEAVAGVALATISSQAVSAFLVLFYLTRIEGPLRLSANKLCLDLRLFREMARIGVPAGLQMCLFSVANMTVQSAINSYGDVVMAGSSAATSIESFMYSAMNALHLLSQTFTSQNVGAGKYDRVDRVVRICLLYVCIVAGALAAFMYVLRYPLVRIYNTDPAVVEAGVTRLIIMVVPYFIYGMADVFVGAIRGTGHALSPVISTLLCTCLLRILWTLWLDTSRYGIEWVYYSYPVTWLLLLIVVASIWHIIRKKAD